MALRKFVESVLVSADQPNPRLVLAVAALVAPVPPFVKESGELRLEARATVPVILAAVILVNPAPFPLVVRRLAGKLVSPDADPLVFSFVFNSA